MDNVYSFTVQRQNSSEVAPGKSPCVKIKFIKDESIRNHSPRYKIGMDNVSDSTSINGDDKPDFPVDDVSAAGSSPLSICPIYGRDTGDSDCVRAVLSELLKLVEKRDGQLIFAYPVTEEQAPNYASIIARPMDLQTMRHKLDGGAYGSVADMADELVLMCHNALVYNTPDTVYYKTAAQMLNYVRKTFARDALNRFVAARLNWTRGVTDAEMGDWDGSLDRLKLVQAEIARSAPPPNASRASQRNISQKSGTKRRAESAKTAAEMLVAKKGCVAVKSSETASPESEIDEHYAHILLSDDDADDEEEDDDDAISEVLLQAQKAAAAARQRLQRTQTRPVVHLDQVGHNVVLVDDRCQQWPDAVSADMQAMATRVGAINVEQLLGENDRIMALIGQLCHDPNEAVSLTTSKPLEPYSCAEQAVLVETFGDVVTAEFACNMHNFVLDLPPNSAALNIVKNKLNTATNYLTYGVDQIIIKKLKAAAEATKI